MLLHFIIAAALLGIEPAKAAAASPAYAAVCSVACAQQHRDRNALAHRPALVRRTIATQAAAPRFHPASSTQLRQ
jgi:hypothetical protein